MALMWQLRGCCNTKRIVSQIGYIALVGLRPSTLGSYDVLSFPCAAELSGADIHVNALTRQPDRHGLPKIAPAPVTNARFPLNIHFLLLV